jgi:formate dehydrogenase accessory protein FdhD
LVDSVEKVSSVDFDGENRCFVTLEQTEGSEQVAVSKPFSRLIVSACGSISHRSLSELLDSIELEPLPTWKIEAKTVLECVRRLNTLADTFRKTGGVHIAALFKRDGTLVAFAEDVGRHNAVDKAVGTALLWGHDLGECFLASSGRLTGDIVLKAARVGIPIVASLAAAIGTGVEVADKASLTLVGFVRGNRMIIYTCPERINV